MSDLLRRNTEAVSQALRELTDKVFSQQRQLDGMVATMGSMNERMASLERTIMIQRALMTGHGPTVVT
jgi:uncharacterized coiled-coil protein SlyX